MAKRLLIWLASIAVLAVMPPVAPATPQFHSNGNVLGTAKQNVVQYGTLTLDSSLLGELKCRIVAGLTVWNEGGKGLASLQAWQPYVCSAASECPGETFVTTEMGPQLIEILNARSEKEYTAKRGATSLPWPAETLTEEGHSRLNIRKMRLALHCPAQGLVVAFTGNLEPLIVNGDKNGLFPSHLVFEGKGGKTGYLSAGSCLEEPPLCYGEGELTLYVSGELTTTGTSEELVTAE